MTIPGALALARACCTPDCIGYHSTWRICRNLGLKGNPAWHRGFYTTALAAHPPPPPPGPIRVLICAASDERMLAVLTHLLPNHRLNVTLIDACATPLLLARSYADRHPRVDLTTHHSRVQDLDDLPGEPRFDLVITDGLLSLLPTRADADTLIARLTAALTPTGTLLYTTRIAGPRGVLEYDRVGRHLQAAAVRLLSPAPGVRRRLDATSLLQRPARSNPFTSVNAVAAAFHPAFADVRTYHRNTPHTIAHRLHADVRAGHGSTSVGVIATRPRRSHGPRQPGAGS